MLPLSAIRTITSCRCLMLHDGRLQIRAGGFEVSAPQPAQVGNWYAVAATYDGQSLRLYIDGQPVGTRQVTKQLPAVSATLALAPPAGDPDQHFGGSIAQFQLEAGVVDARAGPTSLQQPAGFLAGGIPERRLRMAVAGTRVAWAAGSARPLDLAKIQHSTGAPGGRTGCANLTTAGIR